MEISLYKYSGGSNVINKKLKELVYYEIKLKKSTDILNPLINIKSELHLIELNCNYAYINELNRYYFIDSINPYPNGIYRLQLRVDVLETYKGDILNSDSVLSRSEQLDYVNTSVDHEVRKEVLKYHSNITIGSERTIVLTTLGG